MGEVPDTPERAEGRPHHRTRGFQRKQDALSLRAKAAEVEHNANARQQLRTIIESGIAHSGQVRRALQSFFLDGHASRFVKHVLCTDSGSQ